MLNSVVESFSAKAQMVNSLPGCWDRNLDTLTRPLTSIPTVTFLLSLAIFTKCTDNSIWCFCARFWASASAEVVSPQLIEKIKKCVRLALPHIEGLHFSTTSGGCIVSISAVDFSTTSGWWIMSNSAVASFPAKVNMANSLPGCRDKKFGNVQDTTIQNHPHITFLVVLCHLFHGVRLRNHPLHRHRPLLRPQVCR